MREVSEVAYHMNQIFITKIQIMYNYLKSYKITILTAFYKKLMNKKPYSITIIWGTVPVTQEILMSLVAKCSLMES